MPAIKYKLADGSPVSGVTTICKNIGWNVEPLLWWANAEGLAGRSHRDTAKKAADAGTIAHYLFWCHIHNQVPDMTPYITMKEEIDKAETSFLNFLEWLKMVNFRVKATEVYLVSEQYKFGGTPDVIGWVTDKLAIIDWKTGSGVYEDQLIQLCAYSKLWEEVHPEEPLIGGFHIIRINKENAGFDHKHRDFIPEAWEAFKHALELHNLHKIIKKRL